MINSTKGKSVIDPVDYKGDALVQVWLDSRLLATLSTWLDRKGDYTRFLSEVIKDPLRILVEHLVNEGDVELIDDTVAARAMLQRKYRVNLNPRGRGGKNLLHNITLTERRRKLGDRVDGIIGGIVGGAMAGDVDIPIRKTGSSVVEDLASEAVGVYHELEKEELGEGADDSKNERSDEESEN